MYGRIDDTWMGPYPLWVRVTLWRYPEGYISPRTQGPLLLRGEARGHLVHVVGQDHRCPENTGSKAIYVPYFRNICGCNGGGSMQSVVFASYGPS